MGWKSSIGLFRDLIDRGENGKRSIEIVKDYVDHHGAVCLSGNHEYMFFSLVGQSRRALYDHYRRNGGDTTINSVWPALDAPVDGIADARRVEETCGDLVAFIRSLPFDYETETYILCMLGGI